MTDAAAQTAASTWQEHLAEIGQEQGFYEPLGARHHALHITDGDTLLVSFEDAAEARARDDGMPWAAGLLRKKGYSVLSLLAEGRTWYRDDAVIDFFDALIDDGFFDDFDKVVFAGGGMHGYGAAAFSVACPGATLFLVNPIATLNRADTPWELRYRSDWAMSFGPRYGFAPDMIEAAEQVYLVHDPREMLDAMHASLFRGRHVTPLPAPLGGSDLWGTLGNIGILDRLVAGAAEDALTPLRFAQLWRARRKDRGFQQRLLRDVQQADRLKLTERLCKYVLANRKAPVFEVALRRSLALQERRKHDAANGQ